MRLSRTVELLAASGLEVGALVVSIMAALGVGGLVGASIQADRERQERMRERMIEAADSFLAIVYRAYQAVADAFDAVRGGDVERGREHVVRARSDTLEAERLVPRLQLFFPADYPSVTGTASEAAQEVIAATQQAIDLAEQGLAGAEVSSQAEKEIGATLGDAHLRFTRYANARIWSRRLRPRGAFAAGYSDALRE
jgi:hypothetical protein